MKKFTLFLLALTLGACATKYDCGHSGLRSCNDTDFVIHEMYQELDAVKARKAASVTPANAD